MRRLLCPDCGKRQSMHPEDAKAGWHMRLASGTAFKPPEHFITVNGVREDVPVLRCDNCGKDIVDGTSAVALTMWRHRLPPPRWEQEFLKDITKEMET